MVEMLDGLELWTASAIAGEFSFGVKRKKNSPLYQKLMKFQSNAKNPSRLVFLFGGTPTDESERESFDLATCDWDDTWSRRSDYHLENDDKTRHWWHLLTNEEQVFLNEEYKRICETHYEMSEGDREDPLNIEFRYGFNPAWENYKVEIAKRPKVESFSVVDHGLVSINFQCDCISLDDDFEHCEWSDGDSPQEAIDAILRSLRDRDANKLEYEESHEQLDKTSTNWLFPLIEYFDLSRRLAAHFGERAFEFEGDQYQKWSLDDEPSGVAETLRQAGRGEEPEEPIRDEFDSEESYSNAMEQFEERWQEWDEIEYYPQFKYRICLKFNVTPNDQT